MTKKNKDKKEYCCYICGKAIADEKYEEITTKRGTEMRIHTRCITRGRNYDMDGSHFQSHISKIKF